MNEWMMNEWMMNEWMMNEWKMKDEWMKDERWMNKTIFEDIVCQHPKPLTTKSKFRFSAIQWVKSERRNERWMKELKD